MHTITAFQRHVRRLVYTVVQPDCSPLEYQPRPWLCLHGGHRETLLQEVRSICSACAQWCASDGFAMPSSLHATRALEALCEALPAQCLAQFLAPFSN